MIRFLFSPAQTALYFIRLGVKLTVPGIPGRVTLERVLPIRVMPSLEPIQSINFFAPLRFLHPLRIAIESRSKDVPSEGIIP